MALCSGIDEQKIYASMDPATISVIEYRKVCTNNPQNINLNKSEWVMNIRDLDYVYSTDNYYYPRTRKIVKDIAGQIPQLCLIPMHTFSIGGDDRYIQNRIAQDLNLANISVIQKPLCLRDAYNLVHNAAGCVGMRYHSVVFQTYLNGNNYIIDYTDAKYGKVKAFLDTYDTRGFYNDRYINMLDEDDKELCIVDNYKRFDCDDKEEQESLNLYIDLVKKAVNSNL